LMSATQVSQICSLFVTNNSLDSESNICNYLLVKELLLIDFDAKTN